MFLVLYTLLLQIIFPLSDAISEQPKIQIEASYFNLSVQKKLKYAPWSHLEINGEDALLFGPVDKRFYLYYYCREEENTIEPIEIDFDSFKSFSVPGRDTIVIMDRKYDYLYLMDLKGKVYSTIDLSIVQKIEKYAPFPYSNNINPVYFYHEVMYVTGYRGGEYADENRENRHILICYNLKNKGLDLKLSYPDIYQKYNWGGLDYRTVYTTVNPKKKLLVFSFPASHKILVYDIQKDLYYYKEAKSKDIKKIEYFQKNKAWYGTLAKQDYITFYYKSYSYSGIYYDKYRKIYYRFAEFPNSDFDYHNLNTYYKKKSVIILDKDFNYLEERIIPETFFNHSIFVDRRGLNIIMPFHTTPDTILRIKIIHPEIWE